MIQVQILMATTISIEVVVAAGADAIPRAFDWFRRVEACCTRFNPDSELMQLTNMIGTPVVVSPLLFEAVRFAVAVAEETGGAFDPTVGRTMAARGFNREYSTGRRVAPNSDSAAVSFRDIELDAERSTITIRRPLTLDLGAVAKGLAVDLAARELEPFRNFAIDAGGDLYLGGTKADGDTWSVGIRHPRAPEELIDSVRLRDQAICTSGDYERRGDEGQAHILDGRTGQGVDDVASVTVVAPTAMLADAAATAAFALGPVEGLELFERLGVDGLIITPALQRFHSPGFPR